MSCHPVPADPASPSICVHLVLGLSECKNLDEGMIFIPYLTLDEDEGVGQDEQNLTYRHSCFRIEIIADAGIESSLILLRNMISFAICSFMDAKCC